MRVAPEKRKFVSEAVESEIALLKQEIADPELARIFEMSYPHCSPNNSQNKDTNSACEVSLFQERQRNPYRFSVYLNNLNNLSKLSDMSNMTIITLRVNIICIATLIQCIHSYAAVPADYRGKPFDDAAYREEQKALAAKKKPLPSDLIPAQVVFDSKTAVVGSGWVAQEGKSCSIALGEKDAEGKQVIRYLSKRPAYECFGWKWAKAEEPAVDLTKFDAVSFAIKVSGPHAADQMFFTITEFNPYPVSLRDYDPTFDDGAWHTITIPLADLKWTLAGRVTDRTEVRGVTFMAYTWRKRGADYEVDLDHFTLCRSPNPHETAARRPPPVVRTATGQVIPGRLECAFYDLLTFR
jgi:hypothetical protein